MGRIDWPWHRRRTETRPTSVPPAFAVASEEHELQVCLRLACASNCRIAGSTASIPGGLQVALALSQSANDASATRTRSEDADLAAAKRQSLHIISRGGSRAEALSYQYWDSNW